MAHTQQVTTVAETCSSFYILMGGSRPQSFDKYLPSGHRMPGTVLGQTINKSSKAGSYKRHREDKAGYGDGSDRWGWVDISVESSGKASGWGDFLRGKTAFCWVTLSGLLHI